MRFFVFSTSSYVSACGLGAPHAAHEQHVPFASIRNFHELREPLPQPPGIESITKSNTAGPHPAIINQVYEEELDEHSREANAEGGLVQTQVSRQKSETSESCVLTKFC